MQVTELLASFGLLDAIATDVPLEVALAAALPDVREGVSPRDKGVAASAWKHLPHLLAIALSHPDWGGVGAAPKVADDAMGGNMHCVAHAVHALLSVVEPHVLRRKDDPPFCAILAHLRFFETAALVLAALRRGVQEGRVQDVAARQRSHAATVLLLEHIVQIAQASGHGVLGYGQLNAHVPHSLVLSTYMAVLNPASVSATGAGFDQLGELGGGPPLSQRRSVDGGPPLGARVSGSL